jgi:hypothetical protein
MKACTHVTWHMLFGFKLDGSLLLNIKLMNGKRERRGFGMREGGQVNTSRYILSTHQEITASML